MKPGEGRSTFATLQEVLDSPRWTAEVQLGTLIAANPELTTLPNRDDWPAVFAHPQMGQIAFKDTEPRTSYRLFEGYALQLPSHSQLTLAQRQQMPEHYEALVGTSMDSASSPGLTAPPPLLRAMFKPGRRREFSGDPTKDPPGGWLTPNLAGATGNQHRLVIWSATL